jgi:hypothetical protein
MATPVPQQNVKPQKNATDVDVGAVAFVSSVIIVPMLIGLIGVSFYQRSLSTDCDGSNGAPRVKDVSGVLKFANGAYYIPGERGNWIVFRCGRSCTLTPLWKEFTAGLGKPASASFCNEQLLGVVVDGVRLK